MNEVYNLVVALESLSSQPVGQYEFQDSEGIKIYPSHGGNVDQLLVTISSLLSSNNWIVTQKSAQHLLIEPFLTRGVSKHDLPWLFHVSHKSNRHSIAKNGIETRSGLNTSLQRSYPNRIFFAVDIFTAFEFVAFQCKDRWTVQQRQSLQQNGFEPKRREDLDIWKVRSADVGNLHRDVLFPGRAVYTVSPVKVQDIQRVRSWMIIDRLWRRARSIGFC